MVSPNQTYPVWAVGRRKTASARVRLNPGSGRFTINDLSVEDFFTGHSEAKWTVMRPFEAAKIGKQFDVSVDVTGGGVAGQAGAIAHGVARAFAQLESGIRVAMRNQGLLTRDPRMVERKKPGRPKARKRFQFSKR